MNWSKQGVPRGLRVDNIHSSPFDRTMPPPPLSPPLPLHASKAPRRKFRGKRRYFRRLHAKAASFVLDVRPGAWWDFWHYHADWPGWGNRNSRHRREHLRALATVYQRIAQAAPTIAVPFQCWIFIDTSNAGYDAVFLHSPNPNNKPPFPGEFRDVQWGVSLPRELEGLLAQSRLRVGRLAPRTQDGERCGPWYFVYSPDIGVPIETT